MGPTRANSTTDVPPSRHTSAPSRSHSIGARPFRRGPSFEPTSAHYCRGRLLLLTSHTGASLYRKLSATPALGFRSVSHDEFQKRL